MKRKTNISVQDNRGIRVTPSIILGDKFEGYASGDLLDANAVKELCYDAPSDIPDGSITTAKLADGAVTSAKLDNDIVENLDDLTDTVDTLYKVEQEGQVSGLVPDIQEDVANCATKEELDELIENLEEGGYGIKVVNGGTPVRIGNMNLHKTLPIQNKMRRCTIKDGEIKYISSSDPTRYTTGELVDYTGGDGDVFVEIPEYYYNAYRYVDSDTDTTIDVLILYPYSKTGVKSKKVYIGAFEAASDGTKLASICTTNFTVSSNTIDMSQLTYSDNATTYRGGNGSDIHDADPASLLGRPKTSLTRAQFRSRATATGTGYSQQYWDAYMAMVRLYVVEYASFDSQANYNASLTADGYKQGGLGPGLTTANSTEWNDFNGYNPLAFCGVTISLSNSTGYVNVNYPAGTLNADTARTFQIPSYRGVENPFGNIYKWTDGININTVEGSTTVYTTDDITAFADDTSEGYTERCTFIKPENGYIKTWNWDEKGDFIPTGTPGSSASYLYDYSYWADGWKVLYSGGLAYDGSRAGLFCFYADNGSSTALASLGGRLYYTPQQ